MNQIRMNEVGLSESLESVLAQISAIASVAHFTATSTCDSVYTKELAKLLITTKNLANEAERYRAEWEQLIPRRR
ncbi:hypothetical protein CTM03_16915 [Salmonella enterica subsp. enterica serovar Typhimurium]|nr:hypothetical protein [Salmonella enterica subsp. enterica serovar Newport]EAT2921523.1 hypothetical protein [Salmonella enterica]ECB6525888.1 hypothetical protein [Salmonella enterica subsp. enterica serovar Potsdam]ECD1421514.1 hypothetical protein [Salmonella enterica subsp. enterica serovar Brunei]ECE7005245.1 hypothetical protein [Salmonella enterica subsp. enterica]ECG3341846.1 hypothetical protein [Salmonella enterica subsp. enterica serovar Kambole]ECM1857656.1 hypothetical protein 